MTFWKTIKTIKDKTTGVVHFKRFCYFSCGWFGIYKHIITQADKEKHEHDHPWDFWSLIVEGCYAEFVDHKMYARNLFSIQYNKAEYHHKLAGVIGTNNRCVTIVVTRRRKRKWGYVTKDGWIENSIYRKLKGQNKLPD